MKTAGPDPTRLVQRANELRLALAARPVETLAENTGASYHPAGSAEAGYLSFHFWRQTVQVTLPGFIASQASDGQELPAFTQAMLMYHFYTADGTPIAGQWISFSELPDGRFYNQAFQGYTGGELRRAILQREDFERAAARLEGEAQGTGSISPGALAYRFQALPRMPLLVVYWEGDEDLPGSFQVLFDASASHYMPTDGCALLGSTLCRMLIKAL
jgi:hypothetical protein